MNGPLQPPVPKPASTPSISPDPKWQFFFAGFVGGLLSPLIPPIKEFLTDHRYQSVLQSQYVALGLLLGCVAAFLVWYNKAYEVRLAFTLGLGVPSFIMNVGGAVQNSPTHPDDKPAVHARALEGGAVGWIPSFVTTAYASEEPPPTLKYTLNRTVEITNVDQSFPYRADILDAQQQLIESFNVEPPAGPSALARRLPDGATAIRFKSGETESKPYSFNATAGMIVGVALIAKVERQLGFRQALGKAPEVQVVSLEAEVESRARAKPPLEGWMFLGTRTDATWSFRTLDVPNGILPKEGDKFRVLFPANVRDAVRSKNATLGILSLGQLVQLTKPLDGKQNIWGYIKLLPDEAAGY